MENASKFTVPEFNASSIDIESVKKQIANRLESLTKTVETVVAQVVDVVNAVNVSVPQINFNEGELRASADKIFKIISTVGESISKN